MFTYFVWGCVSSTVLATELRGSWPVAFFKQIWVQTCLDCSFIFSFYSETLWNNAEILHWTPVALKRSIFDLNRYMTIWGRKKNTLCANSSMNFIRAVCVDWMRRAFLACGSDRTFLSSLSPIAIVFNLWLQQNKTCIHMTFSLSSQCQLLTSTCKQRVS